MIPDLTFFKGKRILITGHTGFKGSWLCAILKAAGASVTGYSLDPPTSPSLYEIAHIDNGMSSIIGDIRDFEKLMMVFNQAQPDIVFHLAAQAIVLDGYKDPRHTYETNVMGTVNILEAIRFSLSVKSFVNITTDKVYENKEWHYPYRENDRLGGYDPYSASKACAELVISSYRNIFFNPDEYNTHQKSIASARAGNVIGGGDWAKD